MNTHGTTVSGMPHGGVKHSGYGSDLSLAGLLDYTQVEDVMLRAGRPATGRGSHTGPVRSRSGPVPVRARPGQPFREAISSGA